MINITPKIKICGLKRSEDIEAANQLLPDFIGFVFWKKSKRNVEPEQAKLLKDMLDSRIKAVGVFLDAEIKLVINLLKEGVIDIAQLHGSEDEEYINKVKLETGREVIKAFNVNKLPSLMIAEESPADYIMLDSGTGSGKAFDHRILSEVRRPFFLAGGLSPDNVKEIISKVHPYAVDVSSGVETDGLKDPEKMKTFVEATRDAVSKNRD
ncbi:MAG: phosphoribosylanthranilate isomerase [Eubacterium sp.]|nr:phosphoribosylanthranilate isomerase [Eubacterium sp.]